MGDLEQKGKEGMSSYKLAMLGENADTTIVDDEELKPTEVTQPIETEQPEETKPTETEPGVKPEVGTETKPEEPADPYAARFKELGLDRQFKGGIDEMLRRVPDMNRELTRLQMERAEDRRQLADLNAKIASMSKGDQLKTPAKVDPDRLMTDPDAALSEAGILRRDDLTKQEERIQAVEHRLIQQEIREDEARSLKFIESCPELQDVAEELKSGAEIPVSDNPIWGRMKQLYASRPYLKNQPQSEVLPLLFNAVMGERRGGGNGSTATPTTTTVDLKLKQRASTTPGKPAAKPVEKDRGYYESLPMETLEKELGYSDQ